MRTHSFDLTNSSALITGAAGLLGIEHAAALLECGATVVLTDISQVALLAAKKALVDEFPHGTIHNYRMDVTCLESIQTVQEQLLRAGILIDVLVNNAAIDPKVKGDEGIVETSRLEYFSREQWDQQMAVGLTGAFHCSQVFGAAMALRGQGGVILNIASDLSVFAPDQRLYRKDGLPEEIGRAHV